jgi:hypothetical protein
MILTFSINTSPKLLSISSPDISKTPPIFVGQVIIIIMRMCIVTVCMMRLILS